MNIQNHECAIIKPYNKVLLYRFQLLTYSRSVVLYQIITRFVDIDHMIKLSQQLIGRECSVTECVDEGVHQRPEGSGGTMWEEECREVSCCVENIPTLVEVNTSSVSAGCSEKKNELNYYLFRID